VITISCKQYDSLCVDIYRLPQRRSATGTGSRLPTTSVTSKHVTSGSTRDTTTINNNNSPPSGSSTNHSTPGSRDHSTPVSRDSCDVTLDQAAPARPSPVGKRPRKTMSAGGRTVRPLPGHGEMVESAGLPRRLPPPVASSATHSPASPTAVCGSTTPGNSSSTRQTSLSTISTSLTDVAGKTEPGASSSELARRKAATSSRLAGPRTQGRLPKIARPASDGGGTTTGSGFNRGLGSKLPSSVTGSVGALSDSGLKPTVLSSFQPSTRKQQQSSKSDYRSVASPSSSSSGRLTELRVQFGLVHDTQRVAVAELLSPTMSGTTHGTADDILPVRHDDFPDSLRDEQSLAQNQTQYQSVTSWQKDCQRLEDSQGYHFSVSDDQSQPDEQVLPGNQGHHHNLADNQVYHQNLAGNQGHHLNLAGNQGHHQNFAGSGSQGRDHDFSVEQESFRTLTGGQGITQTLPYGQENCQISTDKQQECKSVAERQNFLDIDRDAKTVPVVGQKSPEHGDNDQQLAVSEDRDVSDVAATYRVVDRTTSACDDDDNDDVSREASCSAERVTLPPLASSVVMTTGATGSTYSHSTVDSGK